MTWMASRSHFSCVLRLALLVVVGAAAALLLAESAEADIHLTAKLTSIKQFTAEMYVEADAASACVLLLNATARVGCAPTTEANNKGPTKTLAAPLVMLENNTLALPKHLRRRKNAVLVQPERLNAFLEALANTDASHIGAVLTTQPSTAYSSDVATSPESKTPDASMAINSQSRAHVWNPAGTNINAQRYEFPVLSMDTKTYQRLVERALRNARVNHDESNQALFVVETNGAMSASGDETSEECLKRGSCLPLGGYSAISVWPPLGNNKNATAATQRLVVVLAPLDSRALFRDEANGAVSTGGPLVALLAAARMVAAENATATGNTRVVFAALAGEPFGGLGSRALARSLAKGGALRNATTVNESDPLEIVALEIGQVGTPGINAQLVARSAPVQDGTEEARDALVASGSVPSTEAPGMLPPGSLTSLITGMELQGTPLASGAVLSEFDGAFVTRRFRSRTDTAAAFNATRAAMAASAIARAIVELGAPGIPESASLGVDAAMPIVSDLADCLALSPKSRGLRCAAASELMTASAAVPGWYVGVMARPPSASSWVRWEREVRNGGRDVPMFAWSYLANATKSATWPGGDDAPASCVFGASNMSETCHNATQPFTPGACLGYQANFTRRRGTCVHASAVLLPSIPAATVARADGRGWTFDAKGLAGGAPAWTESYWETDTFHTRTFLKDPDHLATTLLVTGTLATVMVYAIGKFLGARVF